MHGVDDGGGAPRRCVTTMLETLMFCDDRDLRTLSLASKDSREQAFGWFVIVQFGEANERLWSVGRQEPTLRKTELVRIDGRMRRDEVRCSPWLTIGQLRARIGRVIAKDMSLRNLRLTTSDDLPKLTDDDRPLASYVPWTVDAGPLPSSCAPLEMLITERFACYDYDEDEDDVRRTYPGYYAPSPYLSYHVC